MDILLTGGRLDASFWRLGHYLMDENHPLVLVGIYYQMVGSLI